MNTTTIARGRQRTAQVARDVLSLFKLRIGSLIMVTALVGLAVTPGAALEPGPGDRAGAVGAGRLGRAGAFNQYVEHDSDRLMARTRRRAFVTGALPHHPAWLLLIGVLLAGSVAAAWFALNAAAAIYVFLGAFFYAVVYTVWLKRRTPGTS